MPNPKKLNFDLHAHPSFKGSITRNPKDYDPWTAVTIFKDIFKTFGQSINSQSSLTQIRDGKVLCVVGGMAMEKAYAESKIIRNVLAKEKWSPLDPQKLDDVVNDKVTYFEMFCRDIKHLLSVNESVDKTKHINVMNEFAPVDDMVNVILSIEGSHCLQGKTEESILSNLEKLKKFKIESDSGEESFPYKFLHLTLIHLTRQPACVHCFGTKIQVLNLNVNLTPNIHFRPDPSKKGIQFLGKEIIRIAYDQDPYRILIDIKHMSYLSRQEFYELRKNNNWNDIPIIASHIGVTGCGLAETKIYKIDKRVQQYEGWLVTWCKVISDSGTRFNPWTINMYDEDLIQIFQSKGLMGVSLDERVLGYGEIYGEYMSPEEVKILKLEGHPSCPEQFIRFDNELGAVSARSIEPNDNRARAIIDDSNLKFEPSIKSNYNANNEVKPVKGSVDIEILNDINSSDDGQILSRGFRSADESEQPTIENNLTDDMLFELDQKARLREERELKASGNTHMDYLACNIIHILKVGLKNNFDGENGRPDASRCICIGSDLDGFIDPINFSTKNGRTNKKQNWMTADQYPKLREALKPALKKCLQNDSYMKNVIPGDQTELDAYLDELVEKVFYTNASDFLELNFK